MGGAVNPAGTHAVLLKCGTSPAVDSCSGRDGFEAPHYGVSLPILRVSVRAKLSK